MKPAAMPARCAQLGAAAICRVQKCGRRATRQVWVKSQYVCPNCGVHLAIGAYYRLSTVLDHGTFKELNPGHCAQRCAAFSRLSRKAGRCFGQDRPERSRRYSNRQDRRCAGGGRCAGQPLFMGSMSTAVGEKSHVRLSTLRQAPAAHHFFCQWRRTDAGGHFQPDADGQNQRRTGTVQPQRRVVHQRADPPHHRRSHGQLCQSG